MVQRGNGKISSADTITLIASIETWLQLPPKTILGSATARVGFVTAMQRYHQRESESESEETPEPISRRGLRVTVMVGQTGSGKSTYAASLANGNDVIVSSDALKSSRPRIDAAIRAALKSGKSVIVDASNPTRERRQEIAKIARNAGAATRCVHVDTERSVATARSGLGDKTRYIAAAQFHKRFEPLGNECDAVTRVSGNATRSTSTTKNTARPTNARVIETQNVVNSRLQSVFDTHVDMVIREMTKPGGTRAGHFGIKGISPAARAEAARIVDPLYRGIVPEEPFYGGILVTPSRGNSPLHVIEDLLVLAGHAARDDNPINADSFMIEKRDILKVINSNPGLFVFTPEPKRQKVNVPSSRVREFQKNVQAMLAEKYKNGAYNLSRYYASEKMDGMRALFDGTKLVSRNGNQIAAPGWFLAEIPNGTYDGELFAGRGFTQFQSVISIAKKSRPVDAEWKTLQYRIFDDPASATPFETTLARLRRELPTCDANATSRAFVCLQPQRKVSSKANLNAMFKNIKAMGGEGIMLRNAAARYAPGTRSKTILKVKNVQDAEAIITDFELRPDGALKSLIVEWALSGTPATFHVGSGFKESERVAWRTLFRTGDLVTVQYAELTTTGKARFPVFKAVRTDINRPKP